MKINKPLRAITGLVSLASAFYLPSKLFASNPADLTADNRQFPVPAAKVIYDSGNNKGALFNVPFGKKNDRSAYAFGWLGGDGTKILQGNVSIDKGPLDLGLQATKVWIDGADIPVDYTMSLDLSNDNGGLAGIFNFKNPEKSKAGLRLNTGKLTSYLTSSLKELEPVLGISYTAGDIPVHVSYNPSTKTYQVRTQKAFKSKFGEMWIPEVRLKNQDGKIEVGFGLMSILK